MMSPSPIELVHPTSTVCRAKPGGKLIVLQANALEELCRDRSRYRDEEQMKHRGRGQNPSLTSVKSLLRQPSFNTDALIEQATRPDNWLSSSMVKNIQERCDSETIEVQEMCDKILEEEHAFTKKWDNLIKCNELTKERKKEILHKKWTDKVHEPIRRQIDKTIHSAAYADLMKRRNQLYIEYLEHVNKRHSIHLDSSTPADYFPMGLCPERPSPLSAVTHRLQDPLLSQSMQRNAEQRVILGCTSTSYHSDRDLAQLCRPPQTLVPLGRHGTDWRKWIAMPLTDIDSPIHVVSRRRMTGIGTVSNLPMDMISIAKEAELAEVERRANYLARYAHSSPCVKQDAAVQATETLVPIG